MSEFRMKIGGWGREDIRFDLSNRPGIRRFVKEKFGVELSAPQWKFEPTRFPLPSSKISDEKIKELKQVLGDNGVATDSETRILFATGKSYKDLLLVRRVELKNFPDAVVFPSTEEQVQKTLQCCKKHRIAVVPFGGGTSVVGGVDAIPGQLSGVITLSLSSLNRVLRIDPISQTATVEAGIFGPELEAALKKEGFTLGHFPQSFE